MSKTISLVLIDDNRLLPDQAREPFPEQPVVVDEHQRDRLAHATLERRRDFVVVAREEIGVWLFSILKCILLVCISQGYTMLASPPTESARCRPCWMIDRLVDASW